MGGKRQQLSGRRVTKVIEYTSDDGLTKVRAEPGYTIEINTGIHSVRIDPSDVDWLRSALSGAKVVAAQERES